MKRKQQDQKINDLKESIVTLTTLLIIFFVIFCITNLNSREEIMEDVIIANHDVPCSGAGFFYHNLLKSTYVSSSCTADATVEKCYLNDGTLIFFAHGDGVCEYKYKGTKYFWGIN